MVHTAILFLTASQSLSSSYTGSSGLRKSPNSGGVNRFLCWSCTNKEIGQERARGEAMKGGRDKENRKPL